MSITNVKEIQKEFNLAIRHFRNAVKMAKHNLIIGEVNFQTAPKPVRTRKAKVTPETEGKETP
jgi:hypothetical protein